MSEQQASGGGAPHIASMLRDCVTEATREHFRTARLEFLKGLRSLIDHRIEHLSRGQQKGSSVPVE